MYHQLARFYDWPGVVDFSEVVVEKTLGILMESGIEPPGPIVDLACGTGLIAWPMAESGWDVVAIDQSTEMLAVAREKSADYDQLVVKQIQWVKGDMRDFTVSQPVPVVVCYADSLNHLLTPDDLQKAFVSVFRALAPGGLFLFDLNSRENFQHLWTGKDVTEGENYQLVMNASFDDAAGRAKIEVTAIEHQTEHPEEEDAVVEISEAVVEQFFETDLVENLLKSAGFQEIGLAPFNPLEDLLPDGQFLKTFWQCRKSS